ncbi:MAG: phosphoribosylformylglycinamidine synthase subunit PurS [Acidobacteriota bacterium]
MRGRVVVRLRPEVLDPQGTTVAKALADLGYENLASVRQGKIFDFELEAEDVDAARAQLEAMAEALLANPVIEEFEVSLEADAPDWGLGVAVVGDRRRAERRAARDRRSGLDRRDRPGAKADDRRSGDDRRTPDDRRADDDRRRDERRRARDRRSGEDRRNQQADDFTDSERRQGERRFGARRSDEQ